MESIEKRYKRGTSVFPVVLHRKAVHSFLMVSVIDSMAYIKMYQCSTSLTFMSHFSEGK